MFSNTNITTMRVGIAADHAGYHLKELLKPHIAALGIELVDFGAFSEEASDYADVAHPLAVAVEKGEVDRGVSFCGSGQGVCMTVNKHPGIRAALVWNEAVTAVTRQHNDANIICLPARFVDEETARKMVEIFLATEFEGGRHLRRIQKIPLAP